MKHKLKFLTILTGSILIIGSSLVVVSCSQTSTGIVTPPYPNPAPAPAPAPAPTLNIKPLFKSKSNVNQIYPSDIKISNYLTYINVDDPDNALVKSNIHFSSDDTTGVLTITGSYYSNDDYIITINYIYTLKGFKHSISPKPPVPPTPTTRVGNSLVADNNPIPEMQYINNRTMSLRIQHDFRFNNKTYTDTAWGTGWIFDRDVAPDNNTYYIATNMHVINSMNEGNSSSYRYYYGVGNIGDTLNNNNYTQIPTSNVSKVDLGLWDQNPNKLLDFGLLKVKFNQNNKLTNSYNASPTKYYINPTKNDMIFTGGFPALKKVDVHGKQTKWRQYENKLNSFQNNNNTQNHQIAYNHKNYYSNSTDGIVKTLDMGAGSSGSMVLEESSNKQNYYVIGIYWGGYRDKTDYDFSGAFDLMAGGSSNPYSIIDLWLDYCQNHFSNIRTNLYPNPGKYEVNYI